jgi:heme-degrading monooxygenase HmoA
MGYIQAAISKPAPIISTREDIMAVTIMIRRTFDGTETAAKLAPLIVKLRSLATVQPGYISGRTFRCLDCSGEYLVISTWNSLDDWNRWLNSEERRLLQNQVDDLLGEKTEYRLYEPLVGGIIEKKRPNQ